MPANSGDEKTTLTARGLSREIMPLLKIFPVFQEMNRRIVKWRTCQRLPARLHANKLKEIFSEIEKRYCFEFDAIGTDGDHVHVFVGAAPKYAPSKVMQVLKSIAAKQMFKAFPEIRKELWGGEFWSAEGHEFPIH